MLLKYLYTTCMRCSLRGKGSFTSFKNTTSKRENV